MHLRWRSDTFCASPFPESPEAGALAVTAGGLVGEIETGVTCGFQSQLLIVDARKAFDDTRSRSGLAV